MPDQVDQKPETLTAEEVASAKIGISIARHEETSSWGVCIGPIKTREGAIDIASSLEKHLHAMSEIGRALYLHTGKGDPSEFGEADKGESPPNS